MDKTLQLIDGQGNQISTKVNKDVEMLQEAYGKVAKGTNTGSTVVSFEGDEVSVSYNDDSYIFGGEVEVQWEETPYVSATYEDPEYGGEMEVLDSYIVPQTPCIIFSENLDKIVTPEDLGVEVYKVLMAMLQKMALGYAEREATDEIAGNPNQRRYFTRAFQHVPPNKDDAARLEAAERKDYMNKFSDEVKDAFGDALFDL